MPEKHIQPAFLQLISRGEFAARVEAAFQYLAHCDVCPLKCGVNRLQGELGVCKTGLHARVSSYIPHHGEEAPLRGWRGTGTIFFSRCNLRCVYCQNADISQADAGREVQPEEMAAFMLRLQNVGCHNINLVSATHVIPQILAALQIAAQAGLTLPIVYNTGGYDSLDMLQLLDGVIDIYMPDMKYADAALGLKYSKVPHYPTVNQAAVKEMQRQVGDLQMDAQGIAVRGLLVRHLVLPNNLAGTGEILHFLVKEISPHVYVNLMDQYRPAYHAHQYPELNRAITRKEYLQAVEMAHTLGLHRLDKG